MPDAPEMPPVTEDPDASFTRWLTIGAVGVIVIISAVAYFSHWHWLGSLWFNYTWPSVKGNGPEAALQTLLYAAFAVAIIPPIRRAFLKHVHGIENRMVVLHQQAKVHHEQAAAHRDEMHEAIRVIHRHLGIKPGGTAPPRNRDKKGRYSPPA
jgi:hypothetical protein